MEMIAFASRHFAAISCAPAPAPVPALSQAISCDCGHFRSAVPHLCPIAVVTGACFWAKLDSNRKAAFRYYLQMGGTCRLRGRFASVRPVIPVRGSGNGMGEAPMASRISSNGGLPALIAAIKRSPITVWLGGRLLSASEWARIRNSPEVDAYVLAWIASHVREPRRRRRMFM
jgi:hypothetical protein